MRDVTHTVPANARAITARLFARRTSFVDATKSLRGNHGPVFYLASDDPIAPRIAILASRVHKQTILRL